MQGTWQEIVQTDRGVPIGGTTTGVEAGLVLQEPAMRLTGNTSNLCKNFLVVLRLLSEMVMLRVQLRMVPEVITTTTDPADTAAVATRTITAVTEASSPGNVVLLAVPHLGNVVTTEALPATHPLAPPALVEASHHGNKADMAAPVEALPLLGHKTTITNLHTMVRLLMLPRTHGTLLHRHPLLCPIR